MKINNIVLVLWNSEMYVFWLFKSLVPLMLRKGVDSAEHRLSLMNRYNKAGSVVFHM